MNAKACALLALVSLAGCAPSFDPLSMDLRAQQRQQQLEAQTYTAVDRMVDEVPDLNAPNAVVVVGSVEDIHDVNSSTPFGNVVSEMVRTRLVQRGANVQELRVRSSVLLQRHSGEMLLSRDRRALRQPPAASDYVTGTYAVGQGKVFVSLKVIDARSGRIEAARDFVTARTLDVDRLLGDGRLAALR